VRFTAERIGDFARFAREFERHFARLAGFVFDENDDVLH
jgi:hypothetical protein